MELTTTGFLKDAVVHFKADLLIATNERAAHLSEWGRRALDKDVGSQKRVEDLKQLMDVKTTHIDQLVYLIRAGTVILRWIDGSIQAAPSLPFIQTLIPQAVEYILNNVGRSAQEIGNDEVETATISVFAELYDTMEVMAIDNYTPRRVPIFGSRAK